MMSRLVADCDLSRGEAAVMVDVCFAVGSVDGDSGSQELKGCDSGDPFVASPSLLALLRPTARIATTGGPCHCLLGCNFLPLLYHFACSCSIGH